MPRKPGPVHTVQGQLPGGDEKGSTGQPRKRRGAGVAARGARERRHGREVPTQGGLAGQVLSTGPALSPPRQGAVFTFKPSVVSGHPG